MIVALSILGVVLATIPALLFIANLPLFRLAARNGQSSSENARSISVLIPARDEQAGIEACVRSALDSREVDVEVVVLDDHSTDQTAATVKSLQDQDHRVRYVAGQHLPAGWNGKQFACFQLAQSAHHERWVFLDADVRLQPTALRQLANYQDAGQVDLLSAFPHQQTVTLLEKLLVPMMHVILLGYLPLRRMRLRRDVSLAAGCGQLFMTTRGAYHRAGTHQAIRQSRHDGLKLPRAYRSAGLSTDVVDGTSLATCRMYYSARQVIQGLLKNAHEGIANRQLIIPFSILLLGSAVLPVVTGIAAWSLGNSAGAWWSCVGIVLGHLPRAIGAVVFRQSILGVVFHSGATLLFVGLQWYALWMQSRGVAVAWRGRTES